MKARLVMVVALLAIFSAGLMVGNLSSVGDSTVGTVVEAAPKENQVEANIDALNAKIDGVDAHLTNVHRALIKQLYEMCRVQGYTNATCSATTN